MLQEESLSKKFIGRGLWLYIFTLLSAPLGYIIKIILAHDISLEEFGIFYGIISLLTLLSALNDLGGTESLNFFLPKYIIKQEYSKVKYLLWLVFRVQIISSFAIISVIFLFANQIAILHFKTIEAAEVLKTMSIFFLWGNLLHICTALFSATQNTKLQKSTDFIRLFFTMAIMIGIALFDKWNLFIYSWCWISGIFIAVLFAWFFAYKDYYRPYLSWVKMQKDVNLRKQFIKYSIPTFLTANISLILSQIDAQLVTGILGNEAQGLYSNYLSIMTIPFLVLTPIISFLFPVFTELHARKNTEKMHFLYKNMMLFLIIIAIWVGFFLFQSGTLFSIILFWEAYKQSGIILQFSVPFLLFNLLNQLNFQLLAGTWHAWSRTVSFAIVLPLNIILNLIFIKIFGVEGSALAVGLSWIPLYGLTLYFSRHYITLPPILPILMNIIVGIIAYFFGKFVIQSLSPMSLIWELSLLIIIYAILFFLINIQIFKKMLHILKSYHR